jgi:DNA-binding transcriptional ArsR family regulator
MEVFAALADPTRRRIIELLARGELSAGEVAARFDCTAPAISHHLRVMREAGLVRQRVEGQRRIYTLDPAGLDDLERWVEEQRRFWSARLERLHDQIRKDLSGNRRPRTKPSPGRKTSRRDWRIS